MTAGDLFDILLPRLAATPATDTFLGALNNAVLVASRRLLFRRSSILAAEYSSSFSANTASADLPEGYLGFTQDAPPTISGTRLSLLPPGKYGSYSEAGTPEYYDIRGGKLNLYPTPNVSAVVSGLYYKRPTRTTLMTDDIPWFGIFDDLLGEAVLVGLKTGQWASITPAWEALISREVDKMLTMYSNRTVSFMSVPQLAK